MFLHLSVNQSVHRGDMHGEGGVCGKGGRCAWWTGCVWQGGYVTKGGLHGEGGMCGKEGHVWWRGACVAKKGGGHEWWGDMHVGGHGWQRHAWQGVAWCWLCMAGGGMRGRRDGHCRGRYASYWNAFLFSFSFRFSFNVYQRLSDFLLTLNWHFLFWRESCLISLIEQEPASMTKKLCACVTPASVNLASTPRTFWSL